MLIKKVSLEKFKCFKRVDINLSKITMLTGENSSGKSSFLYGLLAPIQSLNFPFFLSLNDKYANLGDFHNISYKKLKNNTVKINIQYIDDIKRETEISSSWELDSRVKMPRLHSLKVHSDFLQLTIKSNNIYYTLSLKVDVEKFIVSRPFKLDKFFRSILNLVEEHAPEFDRSIAEKTRLKIKEEDMMPKNIKAMKIKDLGNIQKEVSAKGKVGSSLLISDLFRSFKSIGANLNFIGSFRNQPERVYYQRSKADFRVNIFGENYIDQILEWEDKKSPEFKALNLILRELNLLYTIKTNKLRGGRFELVVKTKYGGIFTPLTDVGFGISQFLPIIVADLQLGKGSTLCIAQPEIHLHPSAQSSLGDYFIRQIKENKKNYIIETHSEYFLNKIRLAIVKKELKETDVSVYFFDNTKEGSMAHEIKFTNDGQVKNAPKNFFNTYMMDVMEIAYNA